MTEKKQYIKVLSVDGGGVRGIIPALILSEIEQRTKKHSSELFDMVTGTSTGGLIALATTTPDQNNKPKYYAEDIVKLYLDHSKDIFKTTLLRKIYTGFGLWGSKYSRTNYDSILQDVFETNTLSQTLRPAFIPVYSVVNQEPFIASTISAIQNGQNNFYLKDIAAATSAAPTYFPDYMFKSIDGNISYIGADGGIYANNPELIGIIGIYTIYPDFNLKDIILLSIGTGATTTQAVSGNQGDIGWIKNKDIIGNMMNAESLIAEAAIKAMLSDNHHFRFEVTLPIGLEAMDNADSSNLDALVSLTQDYIKTNSAQIDNLCRMLTTTLV